jgi:hypothetical protein
LKEWQCNCQNANFIWIALTLDTRKEDKRIQYFHAPPYEDDDAFANKTTHSMKKNAHGTGAARCCA